MSAGIPSPCCVSFSTYCNRVFPHDGRATQKPVATAVSPQRLVAAQSFAGGGALGKLANGAIAAILRPYPKLHRADCVGCRKCAQICPAHAITMQSGRPSIDRRACIHCFCCQEFCPKGAMRVGRTAIARLLNK